MSKFRNTIAITAEAALEILAAGVARAKIIGVPQCIFVVDCSGETLASVRMDGAKYLSMHTARSKARTAVSVNNATGEMSAEFGLAAGIASNGGVTNLPGGLPIRFEGALAGAIGVGSGTGNQDLDVARAAIDAVGADPV
ncbi:GlcG/HbpS family heme-binding protein [Sinorhizobium medicae]|uniref:GlcG/HbpS family heme-binding protein n=1 Tax=Sinorhizobium medicae TaxID=110321 RepID=UPI000FDCB75B|nr:heme-binding protein [Sinorhizobium medicae]RVO69939.1 heme-binding protein [Sinorhizobium medicae]